MRLLVVHQNFPGQFGHLVKAWAGSGWDVRGLARETAPGLDGFDGLMRYSLARRGHAAQHAYQRQMESATLHGQAAARAMLALRRSGFTPDVIPCSSPRSVHSGDPRYPAIRTLFAEPDIVVPAAEREAARRERDEDAT